MNMTRLTGRPGTRDRRAFRHRSPHRRLRGAFALTAAVLVVNGFTGTAVADDCDQQCRIHAAESAQQADALPRTPFYDLPHHLPPAPAGTLLRAERAHGYTLDHGMRATRIPYHSRDSHHRDDLSSAVVLTPAGRPPAGGWKVIADAHGTSGVGRDCAPSLMKDIWYGNHLLGLVRAGYAVVATDYAGLGLGGDGPAPLLDKRAEAQDVVNSLPAARAAVRGLGPDWITLGHSQGGQAALAVGELMARQDRQGRPDPGYRGLAAVAPANHLTHLFTENAAHPDSAGLAPLIASGAKAENPRLHLSKVLTPAAAARLDTLKSGCLNVTLATYSDLTGDKLLRPHASRTMAPFLRANEPATEPVAGPALVQQGSDDQLVDPSDTTRLVARLCRKNVPVAYKTYDGLDHNGVLIPSLPDTLSWIADRFTAKPAPSTCVTGSGPS